MSTAPFTQWLAGMVGLDSPIGDLAADAKEDPTFPRDLGSIRDLEAYLMARGASPAAITAARSAWRIYSRSKS